LLKLAKDAQKWVFIPDGELGQARLRLEELEKQLIGTSSLTTGGLRTRRIFLLFMGAGKQGRMRRENEGNWRRLKGSGGSILFGKHLLEPGRMPAIDIECYHQ